MKFGAVPERLLATIDLRLPPEPFINTLMLPGIRNAHPKVYIGGARWGDSNWVGKVYPAKTPSVKFRQLYPDYFNAIELNATHYNIYKPDIIQQWAAPAKGKDFRFCPKFPQQISHHSGFQNVDDMTGDFLESISAFGDNIGPVFLQLSENFSPVHKEPLFKYLFSLPKDFVFFLELRHPAWFINAAVREELFHILRQLQIGAVITDAPGRRDVVHMNLTLPKLFLRFVCNALHPTSFNRAKDWIQYIRRWIDAGMEEAYIFLHPGNDAAIPDLATYWVNEVNRQCQLNLKSPLPQQGSLF